MRILWFIFDLVLACGFTLRLLQLQLDKITVWLVHEPLLKLAQNRGKWVEENTMLGIERVFNWPRWQRYAEALKCIWCLGFWLGLLVLLSLWVAGGPGHAWEIWRWVAGGFTLNYVAAQVHTRLSP